MSTSPSVTSSPRPIWRRTFPPEYDQLWLETQQRTPLDWRAAKRAKRADLTEKSTRLDVDTGDGSIRERMQRTHQLSFERRLETKICSSCIQGHDSRCRKQNCPCLCNDPQISSL